jgi:predicted nucleic acid-binding protein
MKIIVLDVNCLLQIIPRKAPKRWLYDFILQAKVSLAISSEILMEYREILELCSLYGSSPLYLIPSTALAPMELPRWNEIFCELFG